MRATVGKAQPEIPLAAMLRTRRFSRIVMAVCLLPWLSGCVAYKYSSTFFVVNGSSHSISVRTVEGGRDGDPRNFTLAPGELRAVYMESIKCPENFVPTNKYLPGELLPPAGLLGKLEFWIGSGQLPEEMRRNDEWDYFSSEYIEKFTLSITDTMIEYYSNGE